MCVCVCVCKRERERERERETSTDTYPNIVSKKVTSSDTLSSPFCLFVFTPILETLPAQLNVCIVLSLYPY